MDRRDIRRSIREGQRSGDISRAEARSFRREDAAGLSAAHTAGVDHAAQCFGADLQLAFFGQG
jgi:hypothetical protein